VYVRDVDNPARRPFQQELTWQNDPTQLGGGASFTVPPGKRLVIEYVSANVVISTGEVVSFFVRTTVNGTVARHFVDAIPRGPSGGYSKSYVMNQEVRLYAGPGTRVDLFANNTLGGESYGIGTVSGYLVDIP
jgi:hypothetical protein